MLFGENLFNHLDSDSKFDFGNYNKMLKQMEKYSKQLEKFDGNKVEDGYEKTTKTEDLPDGSLKTTTIKQGPGFYEESIVITRKPIKPSKLVELDRALKDNKKAAEEVSIAIEGMNDKLNLLHSIKDKLLAKVCKLELDIDELKSIEK